MTYGIHTSHAPQANGPYSQGAAAGRYVYVSGQIGIDPATGALVSDAIDKQLDQAITNIEAVLAEVKLTLEDVVKATVFLTDLEDLPIVDMIWKIRFFSSRPARSCIEVRRLRDGARIEVECVACR